MKKIIRNNGELSYILTERERVSLVGNKIKQLLQNKLNNIEKYAECKIDFFTDKEVDEDNKWYFNVEKDGKMYTCIYDNENFFGDFSDEEKELSLLMWRYSDELDKGSSYTEVIGKYIDNKGNIYTVENTFYNDCDDVEEKYFKSIEEIELNNQNKEEIYKNLIGQ